MPFGYLVELRHRFLAQYDEARTDFSSLPPYGCAAFNGRLKELMRESVGSEAGKNDAIGRAQREIDDARGIMTENIERVLERGERLDLLIDKTDRLGGSARDFRFRSRGLRRRMWWKNIKLMVLLAVVAVFLVYLFVGFGCGLPGLYSVQLVLCSLTDSHSQDGRSAWESEAVTTKGNQASRRYEDTSVRIHALNDGIKS